MTHKKHLVCLLQDIYIKSFDFLNIFFIYFAIIPVKVVRLKFMISFLSFCSDAHEWSSSLVQSLLLVGTSRRQTTMLPERSQCILTAVSARL